MKMQRLICTACAAMLCLTACGSSSTAEESETPSMDSELTVTAAEGFDPDYGECLKRYFEAVEHKDYAAYEAAVYPPYLEAYTEYLAKNDSTPEKAFESLCTRFDEDGYESWHLTELKTAYYESETEDDPLASFFEAFTGSDVFDDAFVADCYEQAEDMRDVVFTVYALYSGDDAAVPVVTNGEILMLKTSEGTFLFG